MVRFREIISGNVTSIFESAAESSDFEGGLGEALKLLFPSRAAFFEGRDHTRLSVHFRTGLPFGPDPEALKEALFPDLEADAAAVIGSLGLERIDLFGIRGGAKAGATTFSPGGDWLTAAGKRGGGVVLTAPEFKSLAVLAVEHRIHDRVLLSVFIDPQRVYSYYVPASVLLADVFAQRKELSDVFSPGKDVRPYAPMTGKVLDAGECTAGESGGLVAFTGSGYSLSPTVRGLLGFPWFGRTLAMRQGGDSQISEYPCSNCSKCVGSCPSGIDPSYLYHLAAAEEDDEALSLGLERCVECGICSLVCPSGIDLFGGISTALLRVGADGPAEVSE
ncbi:MAG TPA: 4Fe-4S dicluster domain-containing protein [Candidatus Krumholzibacterium sp.]|nr:4Fe-4S dicluster domain-containing protein [Candidatus Krumholzibacterium sp.]